jgi:hypothetical protein
MFCRLSSAQSQPQNKVRIRCRAAAFPKMFLQAEIGTAPAIEKGNAAQLLFLGCLSSEKQECRFLLLQCHAPPPELLLHLLFTTGYKRLAEGGCQAFAFGFLMGKALGFWFLAFWMWKAFGRED